jgi:DNA-binding YbaB/EbfC family protein
MFGNLLGGMEEKQEAMRQKLASATVTGTADGITVTANGNRDIVNIQIDPAILTDKEQLEDLLVVAINRALKAALELEADAAQKLLQESLGGFGGLSSLFS